MSYDLTATEGLTARLAASPEAHHLINEVLWARDESPEQFRQLPDPVKFAAIARQMSRVREPAGLPDTANELWAALAVLGAVGPLSAAIEQAKRVGLAA